LFSNPSSEKVLTRFKVTWWTCPIIAASGRLRGRGRIFPADNRNFHPVEPVLEKFTIETTADIDAQKFGNLPPSAFVHATSHRKQTRTEGGTARPPLSEDEWQCASAPWRERQGRCRCDTTGKTPGRHPKTPCPVPFAKIFVFPKIRNRD